MLPQENLTVDQCLAVLLLQSYHYLYAYLINCPGTKSRKRNNQFTIIKALASRTGNYQYGKYTLDYKIYSSHHGEATLYIICTYKYRHNHHKHRQTGISNIISRFCVGSTSSTCIMRTSRKSLNYWLCLLRIHKFRASLAN